MKTIRLTADFGQLIDGRIHVKGEVVYVRDDVADEKIKAGAAELADGEPVHNPDCNRLADAIDPAIPGGDPAHDAKVNALAVEDHPGLVELEKATAKGGKPKAATSRS